MKKLSSLVFTSVVLLCSCGNGRTDVTVTDSAKINNKEAEATINAPDTTMGHGTAMVDAKSSEFAMKAAKGGMMEVELGRWAQDHAVNQSVKDFGAMMVADHSKANDDLKAIASSKNIVLPGMVDGEEKMHMDNMMAKKGKDFDKAYIDMMVDDHKKDVKEFEDASKDLADPELKSFAGRTLPVLQKHYATIKSIKGKM